MRLLRASVAVLLVLVVGAICACARRAHDLPEPQYVEIVLGDPAPGEKIPLIFGIHGLGDRPELFARMFVSELPIVARLVFPRGLEPEGEGFSWFPLPAAGALDRAELTQGIEAAGESLALLVARLTREHQPPTPPVVFGYSQGGILSFYLAARHADLVSAAVPMAGFLPESLVDGSPPAPVFAFHGANDDLVPVDAARRTIRAFTERGGKASLVEYPHVGHPATVAMVRALQRKVVELAIPPS
jgi:phospholipase/carboxylesterase